MFRAWRPLWSLSPKSQIVGIPRAQGRCTLKTSGLIADIACLGLRVWVVGFSVQGLGFRV